MNDSFKRTTVYFDSDVHRALLKKSAVTSRSISQIVNDAVRLTLVEDVEDLAAFEQRATEPTRNFQVIVNTLRKRGKL